jgi:hypothetical protein
LDLYRIYCTDLYVYPVTQKRDRPFRPFDAKTGNSTMEVDVERCPFRPQRQNQTRHMLSKLLAHFMLRKIGAREPRQGEIKFLAPKIYLLANTHTLTQNSILQTTLHLNVHTHAQGYSRSLRSQISRDYFTVYSEMQYPIKYFCSTNALPVEVRRTHER